MLFATPIAWSWRPGSAGFKVTLASARASGANWPPVGRPAGWRVRLVIGESSCVCLYSPMCAGALRGGRLYLEVLAASVTSARDALHCVVDLELPAPEARVLLQAPRALGAFDLFGGGDLRLAVKALGPCVIDLKVEHML